MSGLFTMGESDVDVRERRRGRLATSAAITTSTGAAVAAIPVVPWTQIAGAGLVVIGSALGIAAKLRERGSRALAGDASAVAGFARRAARWSSGRRGRVAKRLAAKAKALQAKLARKGGKRRHIPLKKKLAIDKLKLEVLYGIEANARAGHGTADVPRSDPASVARDPSADIDQPGDDETNPLVYWLAGGAAVVVAALLLRRPAA